MKVIVALSLLVSLSSYHAQSATLNFECGDSLMYQGIRYSTVLLGDYCWTRENLRGVADSSAYGVRYHRDGSSTATPRAIINGQEVTGLATFEQSIDEVLYNKAAIDEWHVCPKFWTVPDFNAWYSTIEFVAETNNLTNGSFLPFSKWTSDSAFVEAILSPEVLNVSHNGIFQGPIYLGSEKSAFLWLGQGAEGTDHRYVSIRFPSHPRNEEFSDVVNAMFPGSDSDEVQAPHDWISFKHTTKPYHALGCRCVKFVGEIWTGQ